MRKNNISLEAQIRAIRLWKIERLKAREVLKDIERVFNVVIQEEDRRRPAAYLEGIQKSIEHKLFKNKTSRRERQHLEKLLRQAGLINIEEDR